MRQKGCSAWDSEGKARSRTAFSLIGPALRGRLPIILESCSTRQPIPKSSMAPFGNALLVDGDGALKVEWAVASCPPKLP